ncbi:MAG: hypoxanthine phosphoribosyltransferase [Dehalococcoidia bacterium]
MSPATRSRRRRRGPAQAAPQAEAASPPFAHPSEAEFARMLDFYGVAWQYEPRTFPLQWEGERMAEAFTPDFYLTDLDLYVELTTLKQDLVREKNRKVRLLRQLYPDVKVRLLYKRDYLRLLAKYGYGPPEARQIPDIERVLITAAQIEKRVRELGAQITQDYQGKEPVLVGVLRGVACFMADLMRHLSLPLSVDFMAISSYESTTGGMVKIAKDLDENIVGQDVLMVEDIVDTGMTLHYLFSYLATHKPASVRVCTLLNKPARRLIDVPLHYVGFDIPDEFVVGYGLDFHQRYRNLPYIAVLKPALLEDVHQKQKPPPAGGRRRRARKVEGG